MSHTVEIAGNSIVLLGDAPLKIEPYEGDNRVNKELARRENDGLIVSLAWDRTRDDLSVTVRDVVTGESFRIPAPKAQALEVFYHPMAYQRVGRLATTQA